MDQVGTARVFFQLQQQTHVCMHSVYMHIVYMYMKIQRERERGNAHYKKCECCLPLTPACRPLLRPSLDRAELDARRGRVEAELRGLASFGLQVKLPIDGGKLHSNFPSSNFRTSWSFPSVQLPIFDFLHRAPMADAFSLYLSTACTRKSLLKNKILLCALHIGIAILLTTRSLESSAK